MYANNYFEEEAEWKRVVAEEEPNMCSIKETEAKLSPLQQELQTLRPQQEEATRKLNTTFQEQRKLYLLSTPWISASRTWSPRRLSLYMT